MESCIIPTGTLQYDINNACNGYTLYSPMRQKITYLIDMQGYIVHQWHHSGEPGLYSVLLENGNLLRAEVKEPKHTEHGGEGGCIQEIDWEGNIVWEYEHYYPRSCQHHSFKRCKNGNTLVLCWKHYSWEEATEKGRLKKYIPKDETYKEGLWVNFVEEVSPKGEVVWSWNMWDHIGEAEHEFNLNYVAASPYYKQGLVDWAHINSVDNVPDYDEILLCSRTFGEIFFISKRTGEITYRFGNPTTRGKGESPTFINPGDQEFFGPHCATWTEDGKVILFDNGWLHPTGNRSRIVEVDRIHNRISWQWKAPSANSLYSPFQGSVQLLPNGNFLACSSEHGHFLEVKPIRENTPQNIELDISKQDAKKVNSGTVVWEFINPATLSGCKAILTEETSTLSNTTNAVHRAYRYTSDYPALKGKNLAGKLPFIDSCPEGPWHNWQSLINNK